MQKGNEFANKSYVNPELLGVPINKLNLGSECPHEVFRCYVLAPLNVIELPHRIDQRPTKDIEDVDNVLR